MRRLWPLLVLALAGCRAQPPEQPPVVTPDQAEPAVGPTTPERLMLGYLGADDGYHLLDPTTMSTRQLLRDVGEWVDYSADGRRMAYLGKDDNIHLADLVTGETELIAPADSAFGLCFALSPDGERVAYLESGRVKVWQDGEAQTVEGLTHCTNPGWSPDSRRLAIGTMAEGDETRDGGLWVWEGAGEARQVVPPGPEDQGCTQGIKWSPNGEWLAWARGYGDGWWGDLARSDGSQLKRDEIDAGPLEWLPDSKALVVEVHIEAGAFGTGLYTLADGRLKSLGPDDEETSHCLAPDGRKLLVFSPSGSHVLLDLETGEGEGWGPAVSIQGGAWSPDGIIAAAVTGDEYPGPTLWLCGAEGTVTAKTDLSLSWAWRGRWITLPAEATPGPDEPGQHGD